MAQNWMKRSENTLRQLSKFIETPDQDKLDLLKVMRFAFGGIGQSLAGWMQWISNPDIMSTFTRDELEEMAKTIIDMVEKFIAYDIEVTKKGLEKGLAKQKAVKQQDIRFVI